ncbi:MAG: DUF3034 family protein [Planctomycetes bacterium]|jgi:hypothetical protein|nr:DUF3034 family protein [Planctomycetota bacterium]
MKTSVSAFAVLLLPFAYTQAEPEQSESAPPLPTHCVHGTSGVFITPTAYMVNPAPEGEFWGKPTISATAAFLRHKDYQSFVITENILGTIELGYALERIGLGDWPSEVRKAGLPRVDNEVYVHNFNLRYALIPEGGFDAKWMPAITVGSHFKWNDGLSTINRQLGGACNQLGADHTFGTEFTLTASKTIVGLLSNRLFSRPGSVTATPSTPACSALPANAKQPSKAVPSTF